MKTNLKKGRSSETKSAAADDLRKLFIVHLKEILWSERMLIKTLPGLARNASSPNLTSVIEKHIVVTQNQVKRLEKIFEIVGDPARGKKCDAMERLIIECESVLEDTKPGPVRDAGIIAVSQKIEHYEIAAYGTLIAFANTLGEDAFVDLLNKTLAEEKEADVLLSDAAYNTINFDAAIDENKYRATHYRKINHL